MKIEVLGPGCAKCHTLFGLAQQAVARAGLDLEVIEVSSIAEIARRGGAHHARPGGGRPGEVQRQGAVGGPDRGLAEEGVSHDRFDVA